MTAYLQAGDMIHIAIPISSGLPPAMSRNEGEARNQELCDSYARIGVTIFHWTGIQGLDRPVVVSVIRKEPSFADWLPPATD